MPIRIPRLRLHTLYKKRRGILYSCLSHISGSRIALPKEKQRISPRRAVYKRPSPMALREILRFAQHDNTCSA